MTYGFASDKHREFPPMVIASIVNVCNQKCVHCHWPTFAKQPTYKANMMDWDVWTKLCDEMSLYPWSILNLGTDGEPLMHKHFLEMMRYARAKKIEPINMTTNGILLKGEVAEAILKEGLLDVVNISLDAFKAETYKQIRGTEYQVVHDNILKFIERRNQLNPTVKIQVNFIDQPEAAAELEAFKAYWEPKVDNVLIRTYYDATHITGATGPDMTGKQKAFTQEERWPCTLFWRRITVTDNGGIQYCIDDWYHQSNMGNIRKSSLKEIWQSPEYERFRQYHLNGEQYKNPYCAKCTEWQGMRWDFDYFVAMEKLLGKKLL